MKKIGAPPVRLDRDNGNVVGLAIAYTIANADRELPGTVTKFLQAMLPFAFRCPAASMIKVQDGSNLTS